jgi:hypothetical protein
MPVEHLFVGVGGYRLEYSQLVLLSDGALWRFGLRTTE